ncbi:hypothetical protein BDK51DRAFT_47226 [Blyttiomyces helicus]|uniref:Uncharacterized protein n=1 Tax=Blyttiomyces helicus TaxID=388810 RepID=A0A4P9WC36_9FUNG|nr:hypothetical protein BDK51DRAFT_47226 [Blyttiomyces helicus]|eukprot:RKO89205.1 hypothetical protein BDK51DRAFT_47226 [Blyttiomyces helicus]
MVTGTEAKIHTGGGTHSANTPPLPCVSLSAAKTIAFLLVRLREAGLRGVGGERKGAVWVRVRVAGCAQGASSGSRICWSRVRQRAGMGSDLIALGGGIAVVRVVSKEDVASVDTISTFEQIIASPPLSPVPLFLPATLTPTPFVPSYHPSILNEITVLFDASPGVHPASFTRWFRSVWRNWVTDTPDEACVVGFALFNGAADEGREGKYRGAF